MHPLFKVSKTWVSWIAIRSKNTLWELVQFLTTEKFHFSKSEMHCFIAENIQFDTLVFIQPTSPLLLPSEINYGLEKMQEFDSVISVTEEHWLPRWSLNGTPVDWDPENRPMRQEMDVRYIETGAFYITTKKNLWESKLRFSGRIGFVKIPLKRSFQVDTLDDLDLLEKLL